MVALRLSDSMSILEPQNKPNSMDGHGDFQPFFSNPKDLEEIIQLIANHFQVHRAPRALGFQESMMQPKARSFEEAFGRLFNIRVFSDNPRGTSRSAGFSAVSNFQDTGILYGS